MSQINEQDKFDIIRKSIQQDLRDADLDAREKAQLEREEYLKQVRAFKELAEEEAEEKDVENFEVKLFGEDHTARRDIVHATYDVTERTAGQYDKIESYLRKLLVRTELSKHFSGDPHRNVHKEEDKQPGDRVEVMFLRHNHTHINLKKDPVDPIARDEPDEDGGGGRF
jgi:hypothetical protein